MIRMRYYLIAGGIVHATKDNNANIVEKLCDINVENL